MKAFVTGSRVYGSPKPDSDIDLVILVGEADLSLLKRFADNRFQLEENQSNYDKKKKDPFRTRTGLVKEPRLGIAASLRFGNLNLLCCTDEAQWLAWKRGTDLLRCENDVTRELAVAMFTLVREQLGLGMVPPTVEDARRRLAAGSDL